MNLKTLCSALCDCFVPKSGGDTDRKNCLRKACN